MNAPDGSAMAAKVLTVSDGVVHGTREDRSGAALEARLADEGWTIAERAASSRSPRPSPGWPGTSTA